MPPHQRNCDLYADQLRILDYGHALYEPEPNEEDGEVEIGDVGYIESGRFVRISSVLRSEYGIPAVQDEYHAILKFARLDNGVMSSRSVRHEKVEMGIFANDPISGASAGVCISLSCESDRGASLITRRRSKNEKAQFHNVLENHFLRHISSYSKVVEQECFPIKNLHDILLVTQRVMTGDWATIAFLSRSGEQSVSFDTKTATVTAEGKVWGRWSEHASYPRRHGPTRQILANDNEEAQEETLDQCIFITPFRVSDLGWYRRLKLRLTAKSGPFGAPAFAPGSSDGSKPGSTTLSDTSQIPPQATTNSTMESREEGELFAAHEVLAFHAFEVSISLGFDFALICVSEEDIRHFQVESCSLQDLQDKPIDSSRMTFSDASVSSNVKVGRLQLDSEVGTSPPLHARLEQHADQKPENVPINHGTSSSANTNTNSTQKETAPTRSTPRNLDSRGGTSPRKAMNRNLHPCDACTHDQKTCEFQTGVPCKRCFERSKPCTVNGYTKEQYYQVLVQQNGNKPPTAIDKPEKDGYYVLLACNGGMCVQIVSLHFVEILSIHRCGKSSTLAKARTKLFKKCFVDFDGSKGIKTAFYNNLDELCTTSGESEYCRIEVYHPQANDIPTNIRCGRLARGTVKSEEMKAIEDEMSDILSPALD